MGCREFSGFGIDFSLNFWFMRFSSPVTSRKSQINNLGVGMLQPNSMCNTISLIRHFVQQLSESFKFEFWEYRLERK